MRLIGIAVLALLGFSMIALLVTNREEILTRLGLNPKSGDRFYEVFETGEAVMRRPIAGSEGRVDLPIRQYSEWLNVAGFSSNQTFALPLLRDTLYSWGFARIDLTAALDAETTGRLRIFINGRERGELVLAPGSSKFRVDIPLSPLDLNRDWVEVEIDVRGNNPKAVCTDDWDGAVVMTVEPTTQVTLALEEPITSPVDQVLSSGSPARLVWNNPTLGANPTQTRTTQHSVAWNWPPSALDALFYEPDEAPEGAVKLDINTLLQNRSDILRRVELTRELAGRNDLTWPIEMYPETDAVQLREFRNRGTWNYQYSLHDMPNGQMPDNLKLDLVFSTTRPGQNWLYLVTLNGLIVHSERITGSDEVISRMIHLPDAVQRVDDNNIRISLTSDEAKEGICVQGAPAAGQILPGSQLQHTGIDTVIALPEMQDAVAPNMHLFIAPSVDAGEANQAFFTIGQVFQTSHVTDVLTDADAEASEGYGLVAVLDVDYLEETIARIGSTRLPNTWFAFTVIDDDLTPLIKAYRGDDQDFTKAIELYEPDSFIGIMAPGVW